MAIASIANLTDSTVAGSNTQIQYNNSGVFGASSNLTFNGTDELQLTDNTKLTLGTGNDADLYYDGTNVILLPDVVGSGQFDIGAGPSNRSSTITSGKVNISGAVDGEFKGLVIRNSQAQDAGTNETSRIDLTWADGNGDTAAGSAVVAGKEGDYSTAANADSFLAFYTAQNNTVAERMRITSDGDVAIGSTNSNFSTFYVTGNKAGFVGQIHNENASTPQGLYLNFSGAAPDTLSYSFLQCVDTAAARCYIFSDGDLQNHDNSYGGISDERLKQDIIDASSQWDDIKNLRVRKYKFISDVNAYGADAVTHIGVIAQEAQLVSPGLVQHHVSDAVLDDDGNEVQPAKDEYSVQYSVLYMKAVKALQEAMARIEALEAQVAALQP